MYAAGIIQPMRSVWLAAVLLLAACGGDRQTRQDARLVRAAGDGDLEAVARLLDDGVDVDSRDTTGRTAVTAAVYGSHATWCASSSTKARTSTCRTIPGRTRCWPQARWATSRYYARSCEPSRTPTRTNRFGGTALIPAADRGHVEVVRELVRTDTDIDHVNDLGWTALLEAVILGDGGPAHQEIVRVLVEAGADVGLADRDGVTPSRARTPRGLRRDRASARVCRRPG